MILDHAQLAVVRQESELAARTAALRAEANVYDLLDGLRSDHDNAAPVRLDPAAVGELVTRGSHTTSGVQRAVSDMRAEDVPGAIEPTAAGHIDWTWQTSAPLIAALGVETDRVMANRWAHRPQGGLVSTSHTGDRTNLAKSGAEWTAGADDDPVPTTTGTYVDISEPLVAWIGSPDPAEARRGSEALAEALGYLAADVMATAETTLATELATHAKRVAAPAGLGDLLNGIAAPWAPSHVVGPVGSVAALPVRDLDALGLIVVGANSLPERFAIDSRGVDFRHDGVMLLAKKSPDRLATRVSVSCRHVTRIDPDAVLADTP